MITLKDCTGETITLAIGDTLVMNLKDHTLCLGHSGLGNTVRFANGNDKVYLPFLTQGGATNDIVWLFSLLSGLKCRVTKESENIMLFEFYENM